MIRAAMASRNVRSGISRPREWQRDVEAVVLPSRNQVHVIVKDVLPCSLAAIHDQVHIAASGDVANDRRETHADVEQMHGDLGRYVAQRLVVVARDDEDMSAVHRLDIHERDSVGILVADRHLGGALNQIAEDAVSSSPGHARLEERDQSTACTTGANEFARWQPIAGPTFDSQLHQRYRTGTTIPRQPSM